MSGNPARQRGRRYTLDNPDAVHTAMATDPQGTWRDLAKTPAVHAAHRPCCAWRVLTNTTLERSVQIPTVGRTVHYHSHGSPVLADGTQRYTSQPRAAIVTAVPDHLTAEPYDGCPNGMLDHEGRPMWVVSLAVLNPTGLFFDERVPYADEPTPGHWTWPPRT